MGLAASQARLLSLTARMHDIEYKAQKLEAQKLQMANQSQQVYQEYEDALNMQKIQYKIIGSDGSAYFKDATVKALVTATGEAKSDYIMHNIATNQMYCTSAQIKNFLIALAEGATFETNDAGKYVDADGTVLTNEDGTELTDKDKLVFAGVIKTYGDDEAQQKKFAELMGDTLGSSASYHMLFQEMKACYEKHGGDATKAFIAVDVASGAPAAEDENGFDKSDYAPDADIEKQFTNPTYLTNMINEGFIVLHKMTGDNITGAADEVNVAVDPALQQVNDEVDLKKAEAKYEADMAKINAKDKKYDTDIAALEQERNAIKTEIDTLKTVAKDNVERTFKLFS